MAMGWTGMQVRELHGPRRSGGEGTHAISSYPSGGGLVLLVLILGILLQIELLRWILRRLCTVNKVTCVSRSTTTTRPCLFSSHVGHSSSAEWSLTLLESIDRPQHRHRMRTHSTNARTWTATNARASSRSVGKMWWTRQSTQSESRVVSLFRRGIPRSLTVLPGR